MQKTIFIIIGLLIIGYFTWQGIQTKPADNIPQAIVTDTTGTTNTSTVTKITSTQQIDNANVTIGFKGFGPGKEHSGTFSEITSDLKFTDTGSITGTVKIAMNSFSTDTEAVTKHLNTKDFFDTTKYPTAIFTMKSMGETTVTGTFTIHGVTKDITFPYTQSGTAYIANFTLNMKEFGIDQKFANETVQVMLGVPFK